LSTFVLVHGAYHGAWCWHKVAPELEARGHDVITFDLPAHGVDTTPVGDVSFEGYVDRVCRAVRKPDEPVILVGHSMAGMVITQAAERCPEAIECLVYLTAYLPSDGESMIDQRVEGSLISRSFVVDEARGVGVIDDDKLEELFYADCSGSDIALARALLRPEPIEPLSVPVSVSDSGFGRVSRVYVRCESDRAITIEQQRAMIADRGADAVVTLQASHSPFLSMPTETAEALTAATEL
jgi:pimeloyl-ACP methyl ester carboxylesterase